MTRRIRVAGPTIRRGQSRQDYQTDPRFIRAVQNRIGDIGFDLAATKETSQAGPEFFSKEQDALTQDWTHLGSRANGLWLNPPYDHIRPWAVKCTEWLHERERNARWLAFLVPAAVGSNWFSIWVEPYAHVFALNGRLVFVGEEHGYPKDLILAVYGWPRGFSTWRWLDDAR